MRGRRFLPPLLAAAALLGADPGAVGCVGGDGQVDGDVTVVSRDRGTWVLYSFGDGDVLRGEDGEPVRTEDPTSFEGWDLAITQWVVASNSGASASADSVSRGALLAVEGSTETWADLASYSARCSDFAAADSTDNVQDDSGCGGGTPTVDEGYIADIDDDPDGIGPMPQLPNNPSLSFWFEYQFDGHGVVPYGHVYVVETHDGGCVKLQITDYYDEDGTSGHVSFSWDRLPD